MGDTHITGRHFGGIHISLVICVWGYTSHGDTHITVTPATFLPGFLPSCAQIFRTCKHDAAQF